MVRRARTRDLKIKNENINDPKLDESFGTGDVVLMEMASVSICRHVRQKDKGRGNHVRRRNGRNWPLRMFPRNGPILIRSGFERLIEENLTIPRNRSRTLMRCYGVRAPKKSNVKNSKISKQTRFSIRKGFPIRVSDVTKTAGIRKEHRE